MPNSIVFKGASFLPYICFQGELFSPESHIFFTSKIHLKFSLSDHFGLCKPNQTRLNQSKYASKYFYLFSFSKIISPGKYPIRKLSRQSFFFRKRQDFYFMIPAICTNSSSKGYLFFNKFSVIISIYMQHIFVLYYFP